MDYMLKRWPTFRRFLDGRICPSNNAAERALRGIARARRPWSFAGSDRATASRLRGFYELLRGLAITRERSRCSVSAFADRGCVA
jgi:hypothetical protein